MVEGLCWSPTRTGECILDEKDRGTEVQDLVIFPHGSRRVRLLNLYVPPRESNVWKDSGTFAPSRLPPDACVFTDLNGHHPSWDPFHNSGTDARGRDMDAWIQSGDRALLNTGEPTYTGHCSRTAPDVTVVPGRFRGAKWTVLPCAGTGHAPIMTDLPLERGPIRPQGPGRPRWAWKRADWSRYTEACEADLERVVKRGDTAGADWLNAKLCGAVSRAAKDAVPLAGRPRPGKPSKPWWGRRWRN